MRFGATLSVAGLAWLEKRFLPAFEKLGSKELALLLTPTLVHLVHDAKVTGGLELHADINVDELFEPGTLNLVSNCDNKVAVHIDPALLLRVLRGLDALEPETIDLRLVRRAVPGSDGASGPGVMLPFLKCTASGNDVHIEQHVPLSGEPLRRSQIADLERVVSSSATAVGFWLEIRPEVAALLAQQADKLKSLRPTLDFAITKGGAIHLRASTHAVTLGAEYEGLKVNSVEPAGGRAEGASPEERLNAARETGQASEVSVSARDVALAFGFHSTKAECCFLGVSSNLGFVELCWTYPENPSHGGGDSQGGNPDDASVALGIKIPVVETDAIFN